MTARRQLKFSVMRCDLASCRGGVDGCNGSECRNAHWDKVTAAEALDLYGIQVGGSQPDSDRTDGTTK